MAEVAALGAPAMVVADMVREKRMEESFIVLEVLGICRSAILESNETLYMASSAYSSSCVLIK